jgi:XRE family aerobic/anaerobic benzoate catabolism transcriptional regulator
MGVPFIELDREIERQTGMALSEIFALYGQPGYRRQERRCLEAVVKQHERAVIATGGSLVTEAATYELLLSACFTVWVKARPDEHMSRVVAQGDYRPMADNAEAMEDLKAILTARTPLYAKADLAVDTSGKPFAESLDELCAAVGVDLPAEAAAR